MALIRVCDRCESDAQSGMKTLEIITLEVEVNCAANVQHPFPRNEVDLCSDCLSQLTKFLHGALCLEDDEEEETPEKSSKEQDETIKAGALGAVSPNPFRE